MQAKAEQDKLVAEKMKKGYREVGAEAAPSRARTAKKPARQAKAAVKATPEQSLDRVRASIAPMIAGVSSADSEHAEWRCDWGAMMYDLLRAADSGQGRPWDLSAVSYSDDASWLISVLHDGVVTVAAAHGDADKIVKCLNRYGKEPANLLAKLNKEKGINLSTGRVRVPRATMDSW